MTGNKKITIFTLTSCQRLPYLLRLNYHTVKIYNRIDVIQNCKSMNGLIHVLEEINIINIEVFKRENKIDLGFKNAKSLYVYCILLYIRMTGGKEHMPSFPFDWIVKIKSIRTCLIVDDDQTDFVYLH